MIRRVSAQTLTLPWIICLCFAILTGSVGAETKSEKSEVWWSLNPVVRPELPEGMEANPIDRGHWITSSKNALPMRIQRIPSVRRKSGRIRNFDTEFRIIFDSIEDVSAQVSVT